MKKPEDYLHRILLYIFIGAFFLYYTIASFARYDNYFTGRMDLGNMTQTVWNTSQGRIFQLTSDDGTENQSRLATHSDFILMAFAPIYWVIDSPKVLLFFQALIAAIGAYYVYELSQKLLKDQNISLAFAFSYLLFPALGWTMLFEFHAVALATTFLLAATYYLTIKDYWIFLIFTLLAALCKEDVWLIIALYGPVLFFFHKQKKSGAALFFGGLIMFYLMLWKAIPHAAGTSGHFALSYFDLEGGSPSDLIKNAVKNPVATILTIFQQDRLNYLNKLFIPTGYLAALFPFWLIFAGGDFFLNLLSKKPELHQIYFHYTATITPFIYISAIYGVTVLKKYFSKIPNTAIAIYIIFFALYGAYAFGPLPFSQDPNTEMFTSPLPYKNEFNEVLAKIPADAAVAAGNELGSHLSHRENIYTLSTDVRDADYVAFFMRNPDQSEVDFNNSLISELSKNPEFKLWYKKYGLTIFKKIVTG